METPRFHIGCLVNTIYLAAHSVTSVGQLGDLLIKAIKAVGIFRKIPLLQMF